MEITGLNPNTFIILQSIDDIDPVFACDIVAEICDISVFTSSDALAKYAGLCWRSNQPGDFDEEDTPMKKVGNRYPRYYLGETANSTRKHNTLYGAYYQKNNPAPNIHSYLSVGLSKLPFF